MSLNPTVGAEMQKTRPSVIVSDDNVGTLPLKVIVPITDWKQHYERVAWMTRLDPDAESGLTKIPAADAFQMRSIAEQRLVRQLGRLSDPIMSEIADSLALVLRIDL